MKIFNKSQIQQGDQNTIKQKDITSFELMKHAASVFSNWFQSLYYDKAKPVIVLCGTGNNGGDGLAVAKLLSLDDYDITIQIFRFSEKSSTDFEANFLQVSKSKITVCTYNQFEAFDIPANGTIIDALLGSGLSRPLDGEYRKLIDKVNMLDNEVVAIDIPSGLHPDLGIIGPHINADKTLSFEIPKFSFFLEECEIAVGEWDYRSIDLARSYYIDTQSKIFYSTWKDLKSIIRPRHKFSSKAQYGFGQFCGGSKGMFGAVALASQASLRSGIGRLIVTTPTIHHQSVFRSSPEAMVQIIDDRNTEFIEHFTQANTQITAIACGPGMGTSNNSVNFLDEILLTKKPLIIDADAINIIARKKWLDRLPIDCVITPHRKEFERLFGISDTHYERIQLQLKMSIKYQIYIILKGSSTSISTPQGNLYFNSNGNPGMATAGSGDVLTGILLSFLAQSYETRDACILSTFIHGAAGDLAAESYGQISMIASDIIKFIPNVLKNLYGK